MATQNYRQENRPRPDIPDCEQRDNATQLAINVIKKTYCQKLKDDDNAIQAKKIGYEANEKIYKSKERRFLATGDNYQRYLNTEISFGTQLVQANEKIKTNVANYKLWDDALAKNLKDIFAAVKVAKAKMSDLRDAAIKLENSKNDSCNAAQWNLVTGKVEPMPPPQQQQHPAPADACKDIDEAIELLLCMPRALLLDVDTVFTTSADIIGIQKFCNVSSLLPLHQILYTTADEFDKLLLSTIALRKTDLDATQKDLKLALKDRTDFVMDLYNLRDDYGSLHATLEKICCPSCNCVNEQIGNCEPRLEECAERVCKICGEISYPPGEATGPLPNAQPVNEN